MSDEDEIAMNFEARNYDVVSDKLKNEPCAFKRASFRAGWKACFDYMKGKDDETGY